MNVTRQRSHENDQIHIKVIGVRYELYDEFISVIADLDERKVRKRPKINLGKKIIMGYKLAFLKCP